MLQTRHCALSHALRRATAAFRLGVHIRSALCVCLCFGVCFYSCGATSAVPQVPPEPTAPPAGEAARPAGDKANPADKWEAAIARFEEADRKSPPPKGAILFVGSSSIVRWKTLAQDFPEVITLNRGFGGSVIADATRYADRIVIPYAPKQIVFYAGDNDIAQKRTPEQVLADFQAFVTRVRAGLPGVRILFLSIKPSPARWNLREQMQDANRLIREWIETKQSQPAGEAAGDTVYIDVYDPMLNEEGQPQPALYGPDKLHMTDDGYRLWVKLVRPVLIGPVGPIRPAGP
jgi:lysophospholipase L1-like esterase